MLARMSASADALMWKAQQCTIATAGMKDGRTIGHNETIKRARSQNTSHGDMISASCATRA